MHIEEEEELGKMYISIKSTCLCIYIASKRKYTHKYTKPFFKHFFISRALGMMHIFFTRYFIGQ